MHDASHKQRRHHMLQPQSMCLQQVPELRIITSDKEAKFVHSRPLFVCLFVSNLSDKLLMGSSRKCYPQMYRWRCH